MTFDELKEKASTLPMAPGVYIMRDKSSQVIYVGKAKHLKNRVTQYFVDTVSHSPKTRQMVSKIDQFDVIVAASEFEALILECSLIKRYQPKYNILLKDGKGYPYIRLDANKAYPNLTMVNKVANDGASYYGPFGSRGITQDIISSIKLALKLPTCSKLFPRDIGKDRPCLHYHMNQCSGWCQAGRTQAEYRSVIDHVKQLLSGNYKEVSNHFRASMLEAADNLNFELAAEFRDKLNAIEALGNKQLLTAGSLADTDVIGYAETHTNGCFTVLHFSGDNLLDKEYEIFPRPDSREAAVSSLMKQYYLSRGYSPKRVLLPFDIDDSDLFADLLAQQHGRRPKLKVPQRGDSFLLVELANKNAQEEVDRITTKEEKTHGTLILLGKMLSIATPHRVEAFDISNTAGTDIVASMVVFQDGKPHKSSYKRFKIEGFENQDDYRAMYQVITRRFTHYKSGDESFCLSPDLLLIDGGIEHASVATEALRCLGLDFPVVGMVKDNRHRTRALVTPDGKEVAITNQQAIFSLIGTIQEEAHRFAISFHKELRSKRLRSSQLDQIKGVGPKRKQDLLRVFKSLSAISSASLLELEQVLPRDVAQSVYEFYHNQEN